MSRPFGQFFACRPHFFYTAAVLEATFLFLVLVVHCPLIRKLLWECEPNAIRGLVRINEFLMWLVEAKVIVYKSCGEQIQSCSYRGRGRDSLWNVK